MAGRKPAHLDALDMGLECDENDNTMKEMVGGCCVCSDEHGWPDNPLVYCDGAGCTVAVHQACYGIITVPIGPWYCRKCESPDRQAKVRCELCPSRSGALKRIDTGGWAHVVCALYIPEIRFGNVTSMEPIILQHIPAERYNKLCYICQELGKINRASIGACMQCNKAGCKQQFHVTCAQGLGLLCEEAGNYLDNVKYCGYCQHHYGKLKKGGNVKLIPPYKPVSQDSHSSDSSPEKEGDAAGLPSTSTTPTVITPPPTSSSSTSSAKSTSSKSSAGRKSSSQQPSPVLSKASYSHSKVPTTSSSIVSTTSASKVQSESLPSTSKAGTSGQDKSAQKKWSVSPSQSEPVANLDYSSSSESSGSRTVTPTKYKLSKGGFSKSSTAVSKPTVAATTAVTSVTTSISSIISTTATQSSTEPSSVTETKDKPEPDPYISPELKQTKKKKALTQSTAQDLSLHSSDSNTANLSSLRDRNNFAPADRIPDSTDDKKKIKTEMPGPTKSTSGAPSQSYSSGLNIQMEPNLSTTSHAAHSSSASAQNLLSGPGNSNLLNQTPTYSIDRPGPSHATPNIPQTNNESLVTSQGLQSNSHAQNAPSKYPKLEHGDVKPNDIQPSLPVSAPHLPPSQGLNLSAHQNNNTIDLVNTQPPSPQPSSSNWSMKVVYEPQIPSQSTHKLSDNDLLYTLSKRPRHETDLSSKVISKQQSPVLIENRDKMPPIPVGNMRNKKRNAMSMSQGPSQPGTSYSQLSIPPNPALTALKRLQVTPPPSTSTMYQDSPPMSPGAESRAKMPKPAIPRVNRAPHMLGNELNPDSAAAARLSEHLNNELAAHSVFRAPSPLVPPPLINKATGARAASASAAIGLSAGGAQSLDQLLERQWEQGSQFLMEQAQHFDIASLLSCLHQLRSENVNLEDHVGALTERRDHLLAVNARLAIPLNTVPTPGTTEPAKFPRETQNAPIRQPMPSQLQRHDLMAVDRSHQSMMRDIQPKPS